MNVYRQTKRYETLRNERNDRIEPHSILPSPFGKKKEEIEDEKLCEGISVSVARVQQGLQGYSGQGKRLEGGGQGK